MYIPDEHHDADDDHHERDDDRETRNRTNTLGLNLTERQHCMCEGADEDSDRELARLVFEDALDNSWRELTHGELHDDHGDREHERGETDHRYRHCA
jgi:hypothetical protein